MGFQLGLLLTNEWAAKLVAQDFCSVNNIAIIAKLFIKHLRFIHNPMKANKNMLPDKILCFRLNGDIRFSRRGYFQKIDHRYYFLNLESKCDPKPSN